MGCGALVGAKTPRGVRLCPAEPAGGAGGRPGTKGHVIGSKIAHSE